MKKNTSDNTSKVFIWLGVVVAVGLVVMVVKKSLKKAGVSILPLNNSTAPIRYDNNWDDMGGYYLKYADKTEQYFDSAGNFMGMRQYNNSGGYMGSWIDASVIK